MRFRAVSPGQGLPDLVCDRDLEPLPLGVEEGVRGEREHDAAEDLALEHERQAHHRPVIGPTGEQRVALVALGLRLDKDGPGPHRLGEGQVGSERERRHGPSSPTSSSA